MINVKERHEYWWNPLLTRMWVPLEFCIIPPEIKFVNRNSRTAGRAWASTCEYNLNYIIQENNKYNETICHEICHSFAKRLISDSSWHGDLWTYLYVKVCGQCRSQYHNYQRPVETPEIKAIKELLRLQKKISACTKER